MTAEGEAKVRTVFRLFGVTDLEPHREKDEALVLNTWLVLLTDVTRPLRGFTMPNGTGNILYTVGSRHWHPAFKALVDAVWAGDEAAVFAAAEALNITRGIPPDSPSLEDGPLPQAGSQ